MLMLTRVRTIATRNFILRSQVRRYGVSAHLILGERLADFYAHNTSSVWHECAKWLHVLCVLRNFCTYFKSSKILAFFRPFPVHNASCICPIHTAFLIDDVVLEHEWYGTQLPLSSSFALSALFIEWGSTYSHGGSN